jgi:CheY-like chemotaxis protein
MRVAPSEEGRAKVPAVLLHRTPLDSPPSGPWELSRRTGQGGATPGPGVGKTETEARCAALGGRPDAGLRPRVLIVHPRRHVADVLSTILGPLRLDFEHAEGEPGVMSRVGQPFSLMLVVADPADDQALALLGFTRRKQPWLPVVVLTCEPRAAFARQALRLGAVAVLGYPCPPAKLREVVSDTLRATTPHYPLSSPLDRTEPLPAGPASQLTGPCNGPEPGGWSVLPSPNGPSGSRPQPPCPGPTSAVLPPTTGDPSRPGTLKDDLAVYERLLVWRALRATGGNREKTAQALGINRTTLYYKMKRYGLL